MKLKRVENIWPIDPASNEKPGIFAGWPNKKQFALVLTHDVETEIGQKKCRKLLELEKALGFRSSYNFVPKRYHVCSKLRNDIAMNNFEVGVHGLNHDGKLFRSREIFNTRSKKINHYLKKWNAVGFRAPAMHHNLDWIKQLNIEYDASTFDTDPFEPNNFGTHTIYPFWVKADKSNKGYVELPYTLPQDFTLFILMHDYDLSIWKKKAKWVIEQGGMVLLNTHPDYMCFGDQQQRVEEYPVGLYENFLKYLKSLYEDQYWHPLPRDMAQFWRDNYKSVTKT